MPMEEYRNQIYQEWINLRRGWTNASSDWNDSVHDEFARNFWQPIDALLPSYLENVDDLISSINQAKNELS
jgi:hypothetical protein